DAAYWCQTPEKNHLRWVMSHPEEKLLDALARLHAAGASSLGENTRLVGSFRAHGLGLGPAARDGRRGHREAGRGPRRAARGGARLRRPADVRAAARPGRP